ncbi:MAG: RnfABCDGE type electron transport complex subunit D, partial [Firmicutes bacterium]|nr:RnfABCDGE type electron transport complex subunit D [Bacillota bacterium]
MNGKLVISSSPHIRTIQSVQSIMLDVLIALGPVVLVAVFLFGSRALITMVVAMGAAMLTEALWLRRWNIFGDGSAAVTGLLLAMTLPANVPWWIP